MTAEEQTLLDRLIAGLLSHGFREREVAPVGWRKFDRQGRETRWVEEATRTLRVGDDWEGALIVPELHEGEVESYHRLLLKCGEIHLRTREREEMRRNPAKRQQTLKLDADELLGEMK